MLKKIKNISCLVVVVQVFWKIPQLELKAASSVQGWDLSSCPSHPCSLSVFIVTVTRWPFQHHQHTRRHTHTQTQLCSHAAREDWIAQSWTSFSEIYELLGQHGQRTRDVSDQRGRAVYKYLGIHFSSSQTGPKRFSLEKPSILLRSSGTS